MSPLEATIYQPAVKILEYPGQGNCTSSVVIEEEIARIRHRNSNSSDEELINTSDESITGAMNQIGLNNNLNLDVLDKGNTKSKSRYVDDGQMPHSSRDRSHRENMIEEQREQILRDAEQHNVRVFEVAGKPIIKEIHNSRIQVVLIDEYLAIGTYLNPQLIHKIEVGAYVDLAKLLHRDQVTTEEDHRLEIINKGGMTYWVPVSDRESSPINSYFKWEQAFRVYINIFSKQNPKRVTELLQYNHVIETAAAAYPWENVYKYNREFRMHISAHPERNWGVIL